MASDIKNVKLGVCKLSFDGADLGYTKGGVEVSMKTETHKVNIDQFGKTPINEYVMGRECTVKAPLAETTVENIARLIPGATMSSNGTAASGTITIATNPTDGKTIVIGGTTVTFVAQGAQASANQVLIGASANATATNLAALINQRFPLLSAVAAAAVVTVTYRLKVATGNSYTLANGTAGASVTLSGATLSGGNDGTVVRVDVPTGVGVNLLDIARELRLHPIGKPDSDKSDDFVIPLAATPGGLSFAYKLEDERVFNCEFNAYPDSVTGRLFYVGDSAAV